MTASNAHPAAPNTAADAAPEPAALPAWPEQPVGAAALRVLILEDQPDDARLMVHALRTSGFEPDWKRVQTEREYLTALETDFDVILADYHLLGMDALRALHIVQDLGLDIPIIVVTGATSEEVAVECMKQGAADYLLKDRLGRLGSAVKTVLEQKRLQGAKRHAEEALRQSEERFSKVFRASPIAISISAVADERLLDVNAGFLRLLGYRRPEVIGRTLVDLQAWARAEDRQWMLQALQAERSVSNLEVGFRTKSGEVRKGLLSAEIVDLAGQRCILALIHDITERQEAEVQIRRQTHRAQALARVAARLNAQLDLEAVLSTICEETARALNVPIATVRLYDDRRGVLYHAGGWGLPADFAERAQPWPRADFDAHVRAQASAGALPSVEAIPELPDAAAYAALNLPALGLASMRREGQLVGSLNIAAPAARRFTEDDLVLLQGVADQAAIAIVNAGQHQNLQRRLQESEAMAAISRALNETLDPERIFHMIVDAARQIIPRVERAVIHLLDEDKQALLPAAVSGLGEFSRSDFTMRPGEGIAGQVIAEGSVVNVSDIQTDARFLPLGPSTHQRSLLVAPVFSGARRLGTLSVQSTSANAFSADDERLLATLGVQAALAIENARLFELERRRAQEAEALQQVTQTLISHLGLAGLLQAVVEAIATIANYRYVGVYVLEGEVLALQAQTGYPLPDGTVVRLDQGLVGRVARTRQPTLARDVAQAKGYEAMIPGVQSAIGVPLLHGDDVLGALVVEADAARPLDQSDLNWLTNVGHQFSVAIQNARLTTHLEKSLQQEKAARVRMVQTEKLAAMGRLVASVAHELNNPLQAIQNALYLVKQEPTLSAQAREDLQVALTEADRMAELINRLRETYRPASAEQFRLEPINGIVYDVQRLIGTHLRHSGITCEFDPDPELPLLPAIRDQLKQVILNLSLNAVEAMPSGGRLTIRTRYLPGLSQIMVTVADSGSGIDPADLGNIFDPFFTTKEGGTGLGLAITYDIIQRHGGQIDVESEVGRGTAFKLTFPLDNRQGQGHNG